MKYVKEEASSKYAANNLNRETEREKKEKSLF